MTRRELLLALATAVACGCAGSVSAQKPSPVISVLGSGAEQAPASVAQIDRLKDGLLRVGLRVDRDYVLETRWAGSDSSRFPDLATELMARRPNVVVVATPLAARAVQGLTRTTPIVMTNMNDPVGTGLVASLAHPGGNITGVDNMAQDILLKQLEIMGEALPRVRKIVLLSNPTNPSHRAMIDAVLRQAAKAALSVETVGVAAPSNLDAAFADLTRQHPGVLFMLTDNSLFALAEVIIARALAQGIPTFGFANLAYVGALVSYATDGAEAYLSVARIIKKILDGADPAEIPVEQATKFQLRVNLKTAKALDIAVPQSILMRADEVIE